MAQARQSEKHLQINKANSAVVATVAIAAFVTTFSLVAARSLLVKRSYQSRVITEKTKAADQLKANIEAVSNLESSYYAFTEQQENIIGGSSSGQGERDGDNAKIVLDSLPSSYDFPALATSLEKLLLGRGLGNGLITGTDDEVTQKQASATATAVIPVEIPFQVSASGSYSAMLDLIKELDSSIRPIKITNLSFAGSEGALTLSVDAKTFYQPEKKLTITKKTVE